MAEDLKHGNRANPVPNYRAPGLIKEIISHIPHMETAYFAGGEPLITEEHYTILEEMIKQGRTDIKLIYNTNLSNLNFKNKNIMSLWEKFDYDIQLFASLDHYGKRAEYLRSGTKWDQIEQNIRTVKSAENVYLCITSTVSVFNYLTLDEFMLYFLENDLWPNGAWQLNPVWHPQYLSPSALPQEIKTQAKQRLYDVLKVCHTKLGDEQYGKSMLPQAYDFAHIPDSQQQWPEQQKEFLDETRRLDKIRNESFAEVFPELRSMLDE